tara:strand:- start:479 stop:1030 length:552 start_codon:yes stop_codon:yes gene_type:complete
MERALSKNLSLEIGPSGRAISQEMDNDLFENLCQHLTMERNANVQYFSMALWFQERDLKGFSSFFLTESKDEMEHAYKFSDYLIARGQSVELDGLESPVQNWKSIEELITYSFKMESELTASIQQLYAISERSSDIRTSVFLDPIVESQIKSEDEFATLLGKVKFAANQPSALLIIDEALNKK